MYVVFFLNNTAQLIVMTRECVSNKNYVPDSKEVTIKLLYSAHNFVLHGRISKFYGKTFVAHEEHVVKGQDQITLQTYAVNRL